MVSFKSNAICRKWNPTNIGFVKTERRLLDLMVIVGDKIKLMVFTKVIYKKYS